MNDRQFISLLVNERAFNRLSQAHIAIKIEKFKKFIMLENSDEVKKSLGLIDKLDEKELDRCVLKLINCIKDNNFRDNLLRRNICSIGYKIINPIDIVSFYVNLDFYSIEHLKNILIINIKFKEGKTKAVYLRSLINNKYKEIKEHCSKFGYSFNDLEIRFIDNKGNIVDETLYDIYGNKRKVYTIYDVLKMQEKLKNTYEDFRNFFIDGIVRVTEESIEADEQFILKEDKHIKDLLDKSTERLNNDISEINCLNEIKILSKEIERIINLELKAREIPF